MKTTGLIKTLVSAAALGVAVLGMAACGGGGGGSDESQIKSRTEQLFKANGKEDWKALHGIISPRSGCTQDDIETFFSGVASGLGGDQSKTGVRDVKVTVNSSGKSATSNYNSTYDGEDTDSDSDQCEKVDGKWYVKFDGSFVCSGTADTSADDDESSGDSSGESGDEKAIHERMDDVFDAMRDEDWGKLYGLISERAREDCSKSQFTDFQEDTSDLPDGFDFSKVGYTGLSITVSGNAARANFTWTYDGEPQEVNTELWVKSDGKWYDDDSTDNAGYNGCGDEQATSSTGNAAPTRTLVRTATAARTVAAARTATPARTTTAARTPTARATVVNTTADQKAIRDLLDAQLLATRARSWSKVYTGLSPRSRQGCTVEEFSAAMEAQWEGKDPNLLGWGSVVVVVTGATATVSYDLVYAGDSVTADATAMKVGGTWYDDNNGENACG
jgi:hypothetical protein